MRRRAGVSAVLLAAALIAGCSTASDTISIGPQDVYDIDFISEFVRVDAADWERSNEIQQQNRSRRRWVDRKASYWWALQP